MFGELCERCGCFLELHSIIASVVVLLNVLAGGEGSRRRNQKLIINIVGSFF